MGPRKPLVPQPLERYISNTLSCDLTSKMDQRNLDKLSDYTNGLKIIYMIPGQPRICYEIKLFGINDYCPQNYM